MKDIIIVNNSPIVYALNQLMFFQFKVSLKIKMILNY